MRILFVTHATASKEGERSLTETGVQEAKMVARRIEDILGEQPGITKAISSPKIRCVQTISVILEELGLSNIAIEEIKSLGKWPVSGETLSDEVSRIATEDHGTLLVGVHADLGMALPQKDRVWGRADKGQFESRPVVAIVDYDPEIPWPEHGISRCEILSSNKWENLLER